MSIYVDAGSGKPTQRHATTWSEIPVCLGTLVCVHLFLCSTMCVMTRVCSLQSALSHRCSAIVSALDLVMIVLILELLLWLLY